MAAHHLYSFVAHFSCHLGAEELCHCGFFSERHFGVFHSAGLIQQLACRVDFHFHLCEHEAYGLELAYLFSELLSFLCIGESHLESTLGASKPHGTYRQASAIECRQHDMGALSGLAENVLVGKPHIIKP